MTNTMDDGYAIDIKEEEVDLTVVGVESVLSNQVENVNTEPVIFAPDFVLKRNISEIDPLHIEDSRIVQFDDLVPSSEQHNLVANKYLSYSYTIPILVSHYLKLLVSITVVYK
jgi:hypothetical protein